MNYTSIEDIFTKAKMEFVRLDFYGKRVIDGNWTKAKIDALNSTFCNLDPPLYPETDTVRKLKWDILGDMQELFEMHMDYNVLSLDEWIEETHSHPDDVSAYIFYVRRETSPIPPNDVDYNHPYIFYKATKIHPNSLVYEAPPGHFTKSANRG